MNADAVGRARACVGARFRPQGRLVETGLDCVGVVLMAWDLRAHLARADYPLRTRGFDPLEKALAEFAAPISPQEAAAGDVLVVDAGGGQPHLVVLTPDGFVHAEARTRRVVEAPGAVAFPVRSAWRRWDEPDDGHKGRDGWRRSF